MTGTKPKAMWHRTIKPAYLCMLGLVAASGCATEKRDIPRAELEEMLRESGATEGLTEDQIERGCTVWGREGPLDTGEGKESDPEGRQVVCPEVRLDRLPTDEE